MLIPNFYTIEDFQVPENQVLAKISLNPNHQVYEGHFPGQPIVPGVIQLQIIKEMMEKAVNQALILDRIIFAKYLSMIVPDKFPVLNLELNFKLNGEQYSFSAIIKNEQLVFTKAKGSFTVVST